MAKKKKNSMDLLQIIAQYGIAGMSVYFIYDIAVKQVRKNTEAIDNLTIVMHKIGVFINDKK